MKLKKLIQTLASPDHLESGVNVLETPVKFYVGPGKQAVLLSVYYDIEDECICVDFQEKA